MSPRITFRLPAPLLAWVEGDSAVTASGVSAATAIEDLVDRHPALRGLVLDEDGRLRERLALFHKGDRLRGARGFDRRLATGDVLDLVPLMAGG